MDVKYKKGGSAGIKGVDFQISLLTIFILNALRKLQNWKLSTENKKAGKFDDIVFELSDKSAILLQAKFKENKKVTLDQLLSIKSKKDDFSLPKYFFSYQEVKTNFCIKYIIICTNTNVENNCLRFLKRHNVYSESLLYCEDDNYLCYTFHDDILSDLKEKINIYHTNNLQRKGIDEAIITDENIIDFLEHVQFYCNYPSGNDVEKIIEQILLDLKFSGNLWCKVSPHEILNKVKSWFQQPHGEYLTKLRAKAIFCDIKGDKYCETLDYYDVILEHNKLTFADTKRIFHVVSETENLLPVIKIYQYFRNNKTKTLYICPDDDFHIQNETIEAFELPHYVSLIIIQPNFTHKFAISEMCFKLKKILDKFTYKKVFLVAESNNKLVEELAISNESFDVLNECVKLEDFSKETCEKLSKKRNIIFQGYDVNLQELFAEQTVEEFGVVYLTILEKLVKNEKIVIGLEIQFLDDHISHCYIERRFTRKVIKHGCGNMVNEIYSEENIFQLNDKIILIADSAGMGKSTVLTKLAADIKEKNPLLWVIKMDLNDYSKILKELLTNNRRNVNIIDLLISKNTVKPKDDIEKFVFAMRKRVVLMLDGVDEISPDYTDLILGILTECQKSCNFVKIFITTRPHLSQVLERKLQVQSFTLQPLTEGDQIKFLTSYWTQRLDLDDTNKEKCEQFAKTLIKKFTLWIKSCRLENDFSAIPLQVRMLAEIFEERNISKEITVWDGCKEFVSSDATKPKLPEKVSITNLYSMFIEKKRKIFLDKGNPNGNSAANQALSNQYDVCLACHRSLAWKVIVKTACRFFSSFREISKHEETDILKIGIVQKHDNEFNFLHRTFAEYFLAESLLIELRCQDQNVNFQRFLIDEVFCRNKFNILRIFFNSFLVEDLVHLPSSTFKKYQSRKYQIDLERSSKLIHSLALEGCGEIIKLILKCIGFKIVRDREVQIKDLYKGIFRKTLGKYVCHNTLNILRFLTKRGGINVKDMQGITPLHYAMLSKDLDTKKILLDQGADITLKDWNNRTAYDVAIIGEDTEILSYFLESILNITTLDTSASVAAYMAAYLGRMDILRVLFKQGVNVNIKLEKKETFILSATRGRQLDVVKYLVQKGADIHCRNAKNISPLYIAAAQGDLEIIKFLMKLSLKTDIPYNYSRTALHAATFNGNLEILKCLVEFGEDINIRGSNGDCLLHVAVRRKELDVIKCLVELGADINIRNDGGYSALHVATANLDSYSVKYLLELGVDANIKDNKGHTALHLAAKNGEINSIKYIVEFGAHINMKSNDGCTALHLSLFNSKIVKCLLGLGMDTDTKNNNGHTALHLAAKDRQLDSIKYLVEFGTDVNITDNDGCTALHLAVGNSNTVKSLLEVEGDINRKNNNGYAPLHVAIKIGDLSSIKYLVEYGGDTNMRNNDGFAALHLAIGNPRTVKCLLELDVETDTKNINAEAALHLAAKISDLGSIKYISEYHADINIKDNNGNTALHVAVIYMNLNTIKCLMALGVDVNILNDIGQTPLHLAAEKNNLNSIKYLLKFGADINVKDNCGRTALHVAAINNKFYNLQCLVESGADINAIDNNGRSVLHLAVCWQNERKVSYLISDNMSIREESFTLFANKSDLCMIKFLMQLNMDLNIRDNDGRTALHYAAFEGSRLIKLLIKGGADFSIEDCNGETAATLAKSKGHSHLLKYLEPHSKKFFNFL